MPLIIRVCSKLKKGFKILMYWPGPSLRLTVSRPNSQTCTPARSLRSLERLLAVFDTRKFPMDNFHSSRAGASHDAAARKRLSIAKGPRKKKSKKELKRH